MIRRFVESTVFKNRVDSEKIRSLLKLIQDEILKGPDRGDLVVGTGGVRKLRVAKPGRGKSGSYRVFYLDLPDQGITHLMFFLLKGERENITEDEKKLLHQRVKILKKSRS